MSRLALPALCLLLAACEVAPAPTNPDPGKPGGRDLARCGGVQVRALIGQNVVTLPATGGWTVLRVIEPGMAVTKDYLPTRLNVGLNHQGRIVGVACG